MEAFDTNVLVRLLVRDDDAESPAAVSAALDQYETGPADLSDYLILESARRASALPVRTFDERLAAVEGTAAVAPSARR